PDRIEFIARAWGRTREDGRVELWADPRHKRVNPVLYQRDQAEACWRAVQAPVLFVTGGASELAHRMAEEISESRLTGLFSQLSYVTLAGAGHMLHHEQPEEVAGLIERFFT
ncbi:MAG: alpha/beta fold hydrolase, partial [Anaerolineae bacterium]|nr:alpha/beta fold hydrolase [Anaerolineae bacterium]